MGEGRGMKSAKGERRGGLTDHGKSMWGGKKLEKGGKNPIGN